MSENKTELYHIRGYVSETGATWLSEGAFTEPYANMIIKNLVLSERGQSPQIKYTTELANPQQQTAATPPTSPQGKR